MKNVSRLNGICPAIVSPCDENDLFDEDAFVALANELYAGGVHGLYLCGLAGEGFYMTHEERIRVIKLGVDLSKNKGYAIAHVGTQDTRSACLLADQTASLGVDAISSIPPINRTHKEICAYYRDLSCAASGLPIFIYHFPAYTNRHLTLEQFYDLFEIDGVVGLKYTDYNLYLAHHLISSRKNLTLFYGRDEQLFGGLSLGAQGGIGSTYNIFYKEYVLLWNALQQGHLQKALDIQKCINALFSIMDEFGLHPGMEALLKHKGRIKKCFRKPSIELSDQRAQELCDRMEKANYSITKI